MKKIIAAAAGLMIAGSAFATVASAAVEFSGDARARYEYINVDRDNGDNSADQFSHRVRIKIKGTTAGGSYAVMRFRVADNWNDDSISDNNKDDLTVDWAYVGVPLGCVELTAGRQPLNLTTGYFNDAGVDNVRFKYAQDATTIVGLYGVVNDDADDDALAGAGDTDKDDLLAVVWSQDWTADWSTTVSLAYANFDMDATSAIVDDGMMGVVAVAGQAGPVALAGEFGYQDEGVSASDDYYNSSINVDDAFGFFGSAGMDFDAFGVTFVAGYGEEGYIWDAPVGFMLVGGDTQLTVDHLANVGALGEDAADTFFTGFKTTYQATEDLGFLLNLGYVNLDDDNGDDADIFEISAQAGYTINDGTVVYARAGYVDLDNDADVLAAGVSLELSF